MASPRAALASNVSRLKAMLPVASYLHLLHQGCMTGFLPRFTPEGKPTGQFDNLAPRDRMDLARYLLDKVLPDAPKELALVSAPVDEAQELDPKALRHLSSDELRRIATTATSPLTEDAHVDTPLAAVAPVPRPGQVAGGGEAGAGAA